LLPLAALSFVFHLAAVPPSDVSGTADAALAKGQELLQAQQYAAALAEFERANGVSDGRCGACLVGISRVHVATRQWDKAESAARAAIPLLDRPDLQALAYHQLGVALVEGRKDWAGAEEAFRKAVELGADTVPVARYNLARTLMARKQFGEAAATARAFLAGHPEGATARGSRVLLCLARLEGNLAPPVSAEPRESDPSSSPPSGETKAVGGAVSKPEKIFGPPPVYTERARQEGIEGTVILETIIDEEGCVQGVRVLRGLDPDLDEAAQRAVRRWVFRPAVFQGQPVKVYYSLTINFKVDRDAAQGDAPS
jgi:TonB family protein